MINSMLWELYGGRRTLTTNYLINDSMGEAIQGEARGCLHWDGNDLLNNNSMVTTIQGTIHKLMTIILSLDTLHMRDLTDKDKTYLQPPAVESGTLPISMCCRMQIDTIIYDYEHFNLNCSTALNLVS